MCRLAALAAFVNACMMMVPEAFSQALPQITPGGVVNAASFSQPIAPEAIISIFGTNLASAQATALGVPLPVSLAGTSVTINGTAAPLFFVSPTQINLQAPSSTSESNGGFNFGNSSVVVTTAAGSSTPAQTPTSQISPSLFSVDGSGCGQAAVLNVNSDGSVSVNSPSNSAAPGDYISLYGTGFGPTYFAPADGNAPSGLSKLETVPGVTIAGNNVNVQPYAGLAPTMVGVDQINVQIPQGTPEGCAVPISVTAGGNNYSLTSPTMTISVHTGRGECVDPPTQSYGTVTLTNTVTSAAFGTTNVNSMDASFPSGPNVTIPRPPVPSPSGSYTGNNPVFVTIQRSCPVQGYSLLSAGTLTLTENSSGQTSVAQPTSATGGVQYQQSLPNGFISPGAYTVSASGGPVQFQGTLNVPAPIQIQTSLSPGTQISVSHPFVVNWTGGTAGELVKISLIATNGLDVNTSFAYVDASSETFTFTPYCFTEGEPPPGSPICTLGVGETYPSLFNNSVEVDVMPSAGYATAVNAQGTTEGVQLSWIYRYIFSGVNLAP